MDLQSLEKKLIYLKGVQIGISQGTNSNVFKYKSQIDYEVSLLEKEIQKVQQKQIYKEDNKEKNNVKIFIKKANEEDKKIEATNEIIKEDEEEIKEDDNNDENISKMKFLEVSKNINLLKDKVFQNNNFIKLLNRNKTYQNSLKVQNILKQNNQYQLQIQQNQQLYDLLNLKINNNTLYQKLYQKKDYVNIQINHGNQNNVPKSILKTKSNENVIKKQVQMNIEKNEVKEIPVHENKKNLVLQKKIVQHNKNNPIIINPKKEEIVNKIEESDEELMKEFQNTIGSLQKLLI